MKKRRRFFVYVVQARDETLYTGIARDTDKRLGVHLNGAGSRYLRGRAPLKLVYREIRFGLSSALKREAEIKKLSRKQKLRLIDEDNRSE